MHRHNMEGPARAVLKGRLPLGIGPPQEAGGRVVYTRGHQREGDGVTGLVGVRQCRQNRVGALPATYALTRVVRNLPKDAS